MFDWGVLKRGVPESVRFCIGDLPMYTFLIPTHPYLEVDHFVCINHRLTDSLFGMSENVTWPHVPDVNKQYGESQDALKVTYLTQIVE